MNVVGIGSTRTPKVQAVHRTLEELTGRFPLFLSGGHRLEARRVPSGVSETPRSTGELMQGARNRGVEVFRLLSEEGSRPALALGLEGGVVREGSWLLLESWAYVTDGDRSYFGSSGCIPLPEELGESVVHRRYELGAAADRLFQREDVAGNEGTFGVLTAGTVTREDAFTRSLLHALAPFYNGSAYSL